MIVYDYTICVAKGYRVRGYIADRQDYSEVVCESIMLVSAVGMYSKFYRCVVSTESVSVM